MQITFAYELTVLQSVLYKSQNAPCVPMEMIARSIPTDTALLSGSPVCYIHKESMYIIFGYELTLLQSVSYTSPNALCVPMELIACSVPMDTALFLGSPVCYDWNKPMHIIFGDELTVLQSVLYKSPNAPCVPTELIARSIPTDTALFLRSPVCYI